MSNKKCEWCGEEYLDSLFFKFTVVSPNGHAESGEACADCVGSWFTETPEDVQNMMIWKVEA